MPISLPKPGSGAFYTYARDAQAAAAQNARAGVPVQVAFKPGRGYYLHQTAQQNTPQPSSSSGGNAGLYGGIGPNAFVNNVYRPQETALANQQSTRQAALKSMVTDFLNSLQNVGSQLAPYQAAASQQSADARNAAAALAAANPNAVTQNDLAAINAPQAQRDAVTQQNNTAFGGNAALLQYTGGAIPADQFRADAAARAAYLQSLPALAASIGVQGFNSLNNLDSQENLKLAADKANALLQARSTLADYVTKNQSNKLAQQVADAELGIKTFNAKTSRINAKTSQTNALANAKAKAVAAQIAVANYEMKRENIQIKLAKDKRDFKAKIAAGFKPNAALSRVYGYIVDGTGKAILNKQQKRIPVAKTTVSNPFAVPPTVPGK